MTTKGILEIACRTHPRLNERRAILMSGSPGLRAKRLGPCPSKRDIPADPDLEGHVVDHPGHGDADLVHAVVSDDLNIISHPDAAAADVAAGWQHGGRNHHGDDVAGIELAVDLPACGVAASLGRALLGGTRVPWLHASWDVHGIKGPSDVGLWNREKRGGVHHLPEQPNPALHLVAHFAEIDVCVAPAEQLMQSGVGMQRIVEQLASAGEFAEGECHEPRACRFPQRFLHAPEGGEQGFCGGQIVVLGCEVLRRLAIADVWGAELISSPSRDLDVEPEIPFVAPATGDFFNEERVSFHNALGLVKSAADDRQVRPGEAVQQVAGGHVVRAFVHQDIAVPEVPVVTSRVTAAVTPDALGVPVERRVDPSVLGILLRFFQRIVVFALAIAVDVEPGVGARAGSPGSGRKQVDLGEGVVVRETGVEEVF